MFTYEYEFYSDCKHKALEWFLVMFFHLGLFEDDKLSDAEQYETTNTDTIMSEDNPPERGLDHEIMKS